MILTCRVCGTEKPQVDFPIRKDTGKYRTECKNCKSKNDHRNKTKEEMRSYKAEYYRKNKEDINRKNLENYNKTKVLLTDEEREEYKKHLRDTRKGKRPEHLIGFRHSEETKKTMGQKKIGKYRGENSPNYKTGEFSFGKNPRRDAMWSNEYRTWRKYVFERDDYTCQRCNIRGAKLNAHHCIPWKLNIDTRFELSNGMTVCKDCHHVLHTKTEENKLWL